MFDTDLAEAGRQLPKLIFFRSVRDAMPGFMMTHLVEQTRCLSQFFEVIELHPDCDYDEVCDRYQPDLVLFESGVDSADRCIRNTSAHPQVPKLGFLNADAVDLARATFISDMAEWGVDTFVTHSVAMREYTPEIADRLYVWPNFIDPEIFHDYSLEKVVPVLITGSQTGLYPWRNAVSRVLSAQYPTMICPHFGWHARAESQRMLIGERYARLLNASTFAPACGSVTRDLLRKHLEIPASGACLVTERTAAMESIGFRDMENCVFATPEDVVDKLDALLADPDRLDRITRAGHDLVHSRHTIAQRSQIREWFDLNRRLRPGEAIVQDGPADQLRIVAAGRETNGRLVSGSLDRTLLRQGWQLIGGGRAAAAEAMFLRCLNHAVMPEALVGRAYCQLLTGNAEGAKETIDSWLDVTFRLYGCREPDPVAWATRIRIALCSGHLREAQAMALQFPVVRHLELDRMRAAVGVAQVSANGQPSRPSIAPPPDRGEPEWKRQLLLMLRSCGQGLVAVAIESENLPVPAAAVITAYPPREPGKGIAASRRSIGLLVGRARTALRGVKKTLTDNEWTDQVNRLIAGEPATRAVILEPSPLSLGQRAFRRGLRKNPWLPQVVEMRSADADEADAPPAFHPGDLVYVTARAAQLFDLTNIVQSAGVVLVEGANLAGGQKLTQELSANGDFSVILHDVRGKIGYAIFRRRTQQLAWADGVLG